MGTIVGRLPILEHENRSPGEGGSRELDSSSYGSDGSSSDLALSSESSEDEIPITDVLDNMTISIFKFNRRKRVHSESSDISNNGSSSDSTHLSDEVSDEELQVVENRTPKTSKPWDIVMELQERARRSRSPSADDSSDDASYDAESGSDNVSSDSEEYLPDTPPPKTEELFFEREFKQLGIKMRFANQHDYTVMERCEIDKWPLDKRNDEMDGILSENESLSSDIFQVKGQEGDLTDEIVVTLNLAKNVTKRHKVNSKIWYDGCWVEEEATFVSRLFHSNKAEFRVSQPFQHFVVVSELEVKKVKFCPEGATIKFDDDSKMEVDIPAGAVDADVDVDFKVIPPSSTAMSKYLGGDKPICKTITGVTECFYGNNPDVELKKPIGIKLPFEKKPKQIRVSNEEDPISDNLTNEDNALPPRDSIEEEEEETTVVPFQMVGKDIKMMDTTDVTVDEEDVCNLEINELVGVFAARVRTRFLSDRRKVEEDVRLLFSSSYVVNILTFREREKMPTGFPRLWIQVVDKADVEKVVGRRQEENGLIEVHNSRSPDINVFDGFRLRIDITGNLQGLRDVPKNHYFITYMDISDDNHKIFTVEKSGSLDMYCTISYSSDKQWKSQVHAFDIDPTIGFEKAFRRTADDKPYVREESIHV